MSKAMTIFTGVAVGVLSVIALAPLFGIHVPESIWGMAVGSIAAIAGNAVASSVEKFEIRQPAKYKAEIVYRSKEE